MYKLDVLDDRVSAVRDFMRYRLGDDSVMEGVDDPSDKALEITYAIKEFDNGRTLKKLSGEVVQPMEHLLREARLSLIPAVMDIVHELAVGTEWDSLKDTKVTTLHGLVAEINKGVLKIDDFDRFAGNVRSVGIGCRIAK
jgi:hypothetical protein